MLRVITTYADLDGPRLMAVYAESNLENTDCFFPDMADKALAVRKVEEGFLPVPVLRITCWRRRGSGSRPCA